MNTTYTDVRPSTAAAYGGLLDAIDGIAAAVIAIVGLTGFHPELMAAIAAIVFGVALLIEGGTLLSEYMTVMAAVPAASEVQTDNGLSIMFLAGAAGMVLGILALLGIGAAALTSIAVIVFGAALVLSSGSVRQLFALQAAARRATGRWGTETPAAEMTLGSAGVQLLAGLAAIVLGILAVSGTRAPILTLSALLILGVAIMLTGSTLSGLIMSLMRPSHTSP